MCNFKVVKMFTVKRINETQLGRIRITYGIFLAVLISILIRKFALSPKF